METTAYVYVMASGFKKLYIGVTTQIEIRVAQHKQGVHRIVTLLVTLSISWFIWRGSLQ